MPSTSCMDGLYILSTVVFGGVFMLTSVSFILAGTGSCFLMIPLFRLYNYYIILPRQTSTPLTTPVHE